MSAATLGQGLRNRHLKPGAMIDAKRNPPTAVESVLNDAELFLSHLTSTGKSVDPKIRDPIITARIELANGPLGKERVSELYDANSSLATEAKPVTAETIWACRHLALGALKRYRRGVIFLTIIVIVLCMLSFMISAITQRIGDDITDANKLAAKLSAELGPLPEPRDTKEQLLSYERRDPDEITHISSWRGQVPDGLNVSEVISDLQQFTSLLREIYDRSRSAHAWFGISSDPLVALRNEYPDTFWRLFQLPIASRDLRRTASDKIYVFQRVRVFGNGVDFTISKFNGAIGAYLLPILHALLGAFAFGLRKFSQEILDMTYHPSQVNAARLITAMICGTIVGLFSNFWHGISLQPLAIAFLVGYGVEVFFAFLDKLLQTLGAAGATATVHAPSASASTA